ncbi:MAG: hypothetical protein LC725_05215 [Lentisphaerae bacterium]|nr:hypothetical protein [Lentisphaerota bacterium]
MDIRQAGMWVATRLLNSIHYAGIRGGVYFEARTPAYVSRIRVRTSTRQQQLTTQTWLRTGGDVDKIIVTQTVHAWPDVGEPLLRLPPQTISAAHIQAARPLESVIAWPDAEYWSPERPTLYVLRTTLCAGSQTETMETRFGFREFWIAGKEFILNGIPVRLLGDGSHPRGPLLSILPDQARDFDRTVYEFLKSEFNYHACRLHGIICPGWAVQAADEAGVLIVNQSALTSGCGGAYDKAVKEFMSNMEQQFGEWYWRDVNNPSVVIWDVENELIRDKRTPEREQWVLRLDEFIRKHEPAAIIQHSGAGWYHPRQQVIHVHMQEHYSRIMRQWRDRETVPLVLGEFWMGGRGETRLPNSYEYHDREDWHREEARLYREKMLEMRYYSVSGIMPHCLTKWPLQHLNPLWSPAEAEEAASRRYTWRFPSIRNEGGRGLAPVVVFAWPRTATVIADEPFTREVVVCNDREMPVKLSVVCRFGDAATSWDIAIDPGAQHRQSVTFNAGAAGVIGELRMELHDMQGVRVAHDCTPVHPVPRDQASFTPTTRQIVVVPALDAATATALHELGVPFTVSTNLPADPAHSLVIVPADQPDDALGRTPRSVKHWLAADGRLLVLAQTRAPRWLPLGLPFWSAVRSSIPEFDRGGWGTTNKDLIYTREAPVYAPGHPVFKGLAPCDFKEWDPDDGRIGDDAFIRPNALDMKSDGVYRVLLGATRRENATLVESRIGAGTTLLCQAQVLRQRAHPAARTLFCNLLRYLDGAACACRRPGGSGKYRTLGGAWRASARALARNLRAAPRFLGGIQPASLLFGNPPRRHGSPALFRCSWRQFPAARTHARTRSAQNDA